MISGYICSALICTSLVLVQSWDEQQLASLRPMFPGWDIWTVRTVIPSGYVWCARPAGTEVATINVGSPEELIAAIAEQEA